MIYLSQPYSHSDAAIVNGRYICACNMSARLLKQGKMVYSPIAHGHSIAVDGDGADITWEQWMDHSLQMLALCDVMYVLTLNGWEQSRGVSREIQEAQKLQIPVLYINYFSGEAERVVLPVVQCGKGGAYHG